MLLTIHAAADSPRLRYTLDLIGRWLGLPYQLLTNRSDYLAAVGPRIHYGAARITPDELFLPAGPLLFSQGIHPLHPEVAGREDLPFFFSRPASEADFPFDLPALIFYSVTRYEEYLPFPADRHGRFPASQSLADRHHFLHRPWVDGWISRLREKLTARFPRLDLRLPSYQFHPTYDVDLAWAYRRRPGWRTTGSLLRDLLRFDRARLGDRLRVLSQRAPDPFFTFPYLAERHQTYGLRPAFFFLLADYGGYDRAVAPTHPAFHQLIRSVAARATVGIHPSYRSCDHPGLLRKEADRLRTITGEEVRHSRQHFLRLRFPETYRRLLAAGIGHDYTLGYADAPGFRAGTAQSFPWYDLEREQATSLLLHPFQVMDVTLRRYRRLTPVAAQAEVCRLITEVRRTGGTFRTLWHNSSFAPLEGWGGWKSVYENIMREAASKNEAPKQA